ncbi:MAG: hypothetical protein QXH12_08900 [Candidatus Caldarchaeum sp.]
MNRVGKALSVEDVKKVAHPAYPYMLPEMLPVSEADAYRHLKGAVDMHLHGSSKDATTSRRSSHTHTTATEPSSFWFQVRRWVCFTQRSG